MSSEENFCEKNAIIIGGGLVGAFCLCMLAERGYKVTLYEKREDIRQIKFTEGRSINLALSHRGRKALKLIGLESKIIENSIPMSGRFLHLEDGTFSSATYDPVYKQCAYSFDRNFLNGTLLDAAEKYPHIKLCFNYELVDVNFKNGTISIKCGISNEIIETSADLIIGADGAFSTMRSFFQKRPLFDYTQVFIDHGYLELSVPSERGHFLQKEHLHIWPRGEFMMIALPNQDQSWTVTLIMPFEKFRSIKNAELLLDFFKSTFCDALPLIGEANLIESFFTRKPSSLISIKCGQYHFNGKFLIIGDAAHAMTPFYGQGMNAGLEDCTILNELFNQYNDDISKCLEKFSQKRRKDAHAICDLAMHNYEIMRNLVRKPSYRLRKFLDTTLTRLFPRIWIPTYNTVCFSDMSYSECIENVKWQNKVLFSFLIFSGIILFSSLFYRFA